MFATIPLIQAPMAGAQGPALCIAVCKAGGVGSIPAAMLTADALREHLTVVRTATDAAFNVNFFVHQQPEPDNAVATRWQQRLLPFYQEAALVPHDKVETPSRTPFDAAYCEIIEEATPPIVSFHFGLPETALLKRVQATGAKVLSSATTVAEARWLEAQGVDAIIAQGREAGGHRGTFLSTDLEAQPGLFALLPQIVDAVSVPVIAAGGIADARGIAAALALGASAVQLGTAYLLTPQSTLSDLHRQALRSARDDNTCLTNVYTGRPARGLVTRFMQTVGPMNPDVPAFPLASAAIAPLRAAYEHRGLVDCTPLWCGEAGALAREEDAGTLTQRLWSETLALLKRQASQL